MNKKKEKTAASDDRILVRQTLKGDRKAFEFLVRKYQQPLVNYFSRMTQGRELSLDFTQEVFLRAYAALHTYRDKYQFSTWLFKIASNLLIDYWRKKKLPASSLNAFNYDENKETIQIPDCNPTVVERYERKQLINLIEQAIREPPKSLRELFVLRHINDFSYEEIARIKDLPLGTVKNRVFQAKELLRLKLEGK
ncbi:MAG: RNA polymerase sigma factor [Candidatus Saccharicenans sp.]